MAPKHRNKRLLTVCLCALALILGAWLLSAALRQNTQYFYNPSDIAAPGFIPDRPRLRVGGIVVTGSVRAGEALRTVFDLRDFEGENPAVISVSYTGALPDLFREGQGILVVGDLDDAGLITASQVLAKHDENYKPAVYD